MAGYDDEGGADEFAGYDPQTPDMPPVGYDPQSPTSTGGAIPETQDESAGLNTSARPDPNATPTSGLLHAAEDTPPVQGIRKLASYLMGAGSTPPNDAQRLVHEVKQNDPGISDDDANLLAVHQAREMGGPAAAWGMVQYNRTAYNAKQAFAQAALNGVDGKAGDIAAAAKAATQAGAHILDGSSAVFSAGPEGITATVTDPETRQRQQYKLTPEQFAQYLDVGKVGQWDKVMAAGIGPTLAKVSQAAGGEAQAPADNSQDDTQTAPAVAPDSEAVRTGKPIARDVTEGDQPALPGTHDKHGRYLGPKEPDLTNYGPELEARADRMFGKGLVYNPQREAWLAAQENTQAERENKLGIAEAGNQAKERIAAITGGARTQSAQTRAGGEVDKQRIRTEGNKDVAKIQAEARAKSDQQKALQQLQKMEQVSNDGRMRERGRMARAEISNPNFLLQKDEDRNKILAKWGLAPQAPTGQAAPAPTGEAAPAPQAGRPAGIPAGAKQWNGKWYTRGQNGEAVLVPGQ